MFPALCSGVGKPSLEHSKQTEQEILIILGLRFTYIVLEKNSYFMSSQDISAYICMHVSFFFLFLFNILRLFRMSKWRLVCGFLVHQIVRISIQHLPCFYLFCFKAVKPPSSRLSPLGRDWKVSKVTGSFLTVCRVSGRVVCSYWTFFSSFT